MRSRKVIISYRFESCPDYKKNLGFHFFRTTPVSIFTLIKTITIMKDTKTYNQEELEVLKEFAAGVSADIRSEIEDGQFDADEEEYSPEEMMDYIVGWANGMEVDEVIAEFKWETLTCELGLR